MLQPTNSIAPLPPRLPPALGEVFEQYRRTHGHEVRLWARSGAGWARAGEGGARGEPGPTAVEVAPEGEAGAGLRLEVVGPPPEQARDAARFLAGITSRLLQHDAETRFFGRELAERYEEITLLYSISEILGSVISLEEAASTILSEVVETLGARRAALWVHDTQRRTLELVAAVGGDGQPGPISLDDEGSATAAVFRSRRPVILDPDDEFPRGERPPESPQRGSLLSVPVSYTPPEGETRTIGVINMVGLHSDEGFSAGDLKLVSAIASQIGAAVENSRLVAESLRRERLVREMELAHDLQLKLLPSLDQFAGYAQVAARCAPADSVGGDFYHLFRLPGGRMGVMIGDVSSHGFGAALIMALTMSAVAIHASEGDSPGEVLRRAHQTLIDELENTEMYLTLFYGVIDPRRRTLTYSNAGHSHAFRVTAAGDAQRLGATNPPFGLVDLDAYAERTTEWDGGRDLLFLFTDGLSDSLGAGEAEGERLLVEQVSSAREASPDELLRRVFSLRGQDTEVPADDRTAVLVRL